jgi:hypothetical protein
MKYRVRAKVRVYPTAVAPWYLFYLPKKKSLEIKKRFGAKHRGWSSLPVKVTIRQTSWRTSIFFDRRAESYILPLKVGIRRKEGIGEGDTVTFSLEIML